MTFVKSWTFWNIEMLIQGLIGNSCKTRQEHKIDAVSKEEKLLSRETRWNIHVVVFNNREHNKPY